MDSNKRRRLAEQVKRFRARFVQSVGSVLGDVIPSKLLMQWVEDEVDVWRERVYSPFTTLTLFLEQVLGEDHSCQDAVARALSARVADGQTPCSLNTGPYCRARARLPVGLLEHLGREIGTRVCAQQPKEWLLAWAPSQAGRRQNAVDARHGGEPKALSAESIAENGAGFSSRLPGGDRLVILRRPPGLGGRTVRGQRNRRDRAPVGIGT